MITTTIGPLESALWTDEWTPSINPAQATAYGHLQTPSGLALQMYSKVPFGGWLAKNSQPLIQQAPSLVFSYDLTVDEATLLSAQVVETDVKITDAAGWTYDGSFQWNIVKGWLAQVGSPWKDTSVKITPPVPGHPLSVSIAYALDYAAHALTVVSVTVDGTVYTIGAKSQAAQVGWSKSAIVTQLQQCSRQQPGGYTLTFSGITHTLTS